LNPLNPLFSIIIFAIAFATAFTIKVIFKPAIVLGRYESIDGLRGFLAIGVFIHHTTIWYQYLHSGIWDVPKSNLYTLLGQGSVSLFFMITSFLFVSKIINAKDGKFDVKQFFIGRLYRLTPLYFFTIFILFVSVMFVTNWQLKVTVLKLLNSIAAWLLFSIFGTPAINDSSFTTLANAGVVWSLPYEWVFYFFIPIFYMLVWKRKIPLLLFILSLAFSVYFFIKNGFIWYHLICFAGGGIAPVLIKFFPACKKINKHFVSTIILFIPIII
jgi:peptidoglycan/LPS O-acetylase OafA/YrhL